MLTTVERLIQAPWDSWELLGVSRREVGREMEERAVKGVTVNKGDTSAFS